MSFSPVAGVLLALWGAVLPGNSHAAPAVPSMASGLNHTHRGDSAKITVTSPTVFAPRFGFVPVRLAIDNQQPREVTWRASFHSSWNTGNLSMSQQTSESFVVPGGRSHERWIFAPVADAGLMAGYFYRGPFTGSIGGTGLGETTFHLNSGASGGPATSQMMPWAVSASLESVVRSRIAALQVPAGTPPPRLRGRVPPGAVPAMRPLIAGPQNLSVFDPADSLGDWRVWSPFARVMMRAAEFSSLDPANRTALRNWVALGGVLSLVPEGAGRDSSQRFGAGSIQTLAAPISATQAEDSGGLFTAPGLFGATLAQPHSGELSLEQTPLAARAPKAAPPGDWLVYFFVAFTLVVAPVNLFAFAPARRRHRLFFTVPLISFVAVVVLGTVIFLQDGLGGTGARRALVVLLPGDNQAAVFQEQVSRTGVLFGSGFPLANDTICAQVGLDTSLPAARGPALERSDSRAAGDWFRSRARQGQHLRRLTPTRARVERVGVAPDGAPVVQSSVGTTLRDFCYIDRSGVAWGAESVPPGTRVNLARLAKEAEFVLRTTQFSAMASAHFGKLMEASTQSDGVPRGRFIALANDSELAPLPTHASVRWNDSSVMFTGLLENDLGAAAASPLEGSSR